MKYSKLSLNETRRYSEHTIRTKLFIQIETTNKKFDKRKKKENPKISIPVALMAGGPPD
jgi:hypothetical protein